jgi:hypothetical protein
MTTGPGALSGSRCNIGGVANLQPGSWISRTIGSYYAAYTIPRPAQYGQVDSTKQVPISCMQLLISQTSPGSPPTYTTGVLYGGDTYVCRYTEKNPFLFFNDWLVKAPEDIIYDYRNYINVPYPMFWINNDVIYYNLLARASTNRRLDGGLNIQPFYVDQGNFYLFCNGVRDFYVESTINVGYRDYGDSIETMFYNPYGFTDVNQMFRSDIIKTPEFYKYDYSLSANRFWNQWLTWSKCLRPDYSPSLAYTCFAYYPRNVNYSLPQADEQILDNWRVFLPNNYKEFPSPVVCVKPVNKTGALFFMNDYTPLMLPGIESMSSNEGTLYNVGAGNLFAQPLQIINNADKSLQFGSCQNRYSVIDTPHGTFWASASAGKIYQDAPSKTFFNRGDRTVDISANGLKFWLAKYLPFQLLTQFPDYPYTDNPVAGIGLQMTYDAVKETVYISKTDYIAIDPANTFFINGTNQFYYNTPWLTSVKIQLGDPRYFYNCCWTLSYNPREVPEQGVKKCFVSFHTWTPGLYISTDNNFISSNAGTGLWLHNVNTQQFCTYYGTPAPCSVEVGLNSGSEVVTIENIEYLMDAYIWANNGIDRFNAFDGGFQEAQVFNNEQSTLPLLLTLRPNNDPYTCLNYPFITAGGNNVLYTKVENKYRFSIIRDFTNDRGEYDLAEVPMRVTQPNGFQWNINLLYFDWAKSTFQLKKIRHYQSRLLLTLYNVGNTSRSLRSIKTNIQVSKR